MTKTKFEVMNECNALDIPVGPILSMKELAEEPSLRETGTVVEVDHPTRGKYLSVGNPIKLSDSITEVERSPLLGEHTDEILTKVLKFTPREIAEIKASGATGQAPNFSSRPRSRSCASWFMASRPSARPCWRRCSSAARTLSASMWRRRSPASGPDPLKEAAVAAKLPIFQPASYRKPEVWEEFKTLKPDLQVMAFVTLFVPEEFLNIPTHGSIQYHPSLLPAYRGASAINWPIILGEKETGLSIFWPDNGLDTGAVLLQKKTPIGPKDTLGTVYFDRLFPMGVEAMLELVDR